MRRPLAPALAFLAIGLVSLVHVAPGCGTSQVAVQDFCGWLGDPGNCYRRLAAGAVGLDGKVTPRCGVELKTMMGQDTAVDSSGKAYDPQNSKPTFGGFVVQKIEDRNKLARCNFVGGNGGYIIFDPPLDADAFPPSGFMFTIHDNQDAVCATGSFTSTNSFSIGFPEPESAGAGGAGGAGGSTGTGTTSSTRDTSPLYYGTFSIAPAEDVPQLFNTTCPNNENHRFNSYQLQKCDGVDADGASTKEEDNLDQLVPMAEVESSGGTVGGMGYVRLKVYWPPTGAPPLDQKPPTIKDEHSALSDQKPVVVQYFDCRLPGPPDQCSNLTQDGLETDVDCGQACGAKKLCGGGKKCLENADCQSNVCMDSMGLFTCTDPPM